MEKKVERKRIRTKEKKANEKGRLRQREGWKKRQRKTGKED